MKVIGHETVSQKINIRQNMAAHFSHKKQVIFFVGENGLFVIALIVNVINSVGFKWHILDFYLMKKMTAHLVLQGEFSVRFGNDDALLALHLQDARRVRLSAIFNGKSDLPCISKMQGK